MKYFYFAVQIKENEKYYAYVVKTSEYENLISLFKIKGIISANIFETKKYASKVVDAWNKGYRANGKYFFDSPSFQVKLILLWQITGSRKKRKP